MFLAIFNFLNQLYNIFEGRVIFYSCLWRSWVFTFLKKCKIYCGIPLGHLYFKLSTFHPGSSSKCISLQYYIIVSHDSFIWFRICQKDQFLLNIIASSGRMPFGWDTGVNRDSGNPIHSSGIYFWAFATIPKPYAWFWWCMMKAILIKFALKGAGGYSTINYTCLNYKIVIKHYKGRKIAW